MNKFNILTVINSIILLVLIIAGFFYYLESNKTQDIVYVDNVILFNEFNMTKDIKLIEEKKMTATKKSLDSLYLSYQNIKDKKSNNAKSLESLLNSKSQELQKLQTNYANHLSQKVWDRLNDYIKEYCNNQNYDLVFGTSGNGNVMYAKEHINITNAILDFANKKYEGN